MSALAPELVALLADWSLRFGVLIAGPALLVALGRPRAAAARLFVLRLTLVGGVLLPLSPGWWALPESPPAAVAIAETPARPVAPRPEPVESPRTAPRPRPEPAGPIALADAFEREPEPAALDWHPVVACVWLGGCGYKLVRLGVGQWWLGRVRRRASLAGGASRREFDSIGAELGVRRPVSLLTSGEVTGPALFGGRRPAVVVPPGWDALPPGERRAVLLHELTHVRCGDDGWGVAEGVVAAAFWFHPAVRWLLLRAADARESRCDASVLRRGVAPVQLAAALLATARRAGPGRSLLAGGAMAMASRSSVTTRITQLLEADMATWTRPLTTARALLAGGVVLLTCVGLGGYGVVAAPPAVEVPAGVPVVESAPRGRLAGIVTGPDGAPVAGATVLAGTDAGTGAVRAATTDAAGRFAFADLPPARTAFPSVLVRALKGGFAPGNAVVLPGNVGEVAIALPAAGTFRGVVRGPQGQPIAGARVEVGSVTRGEGNGNPAGWSLTTYGYSPPALIRGTPAEEAVVTSTDVAGGFGFRSVPRGGELLVRVTAPGFAELDTATRLDAPGSTRLVVGADAGPVDLRLVPEALLRGRISSSAPGVAPDAAEVVLHGRPPELSGFRRSVRPDAQGSFIAANLPAGSLDLVVALPRGCPATARGAVVTTATGETAEVAVELIPGVEVTGRVCRRGTAEPVAGVSMATTGPVERHLSFGAEPTDARGRFALRLPPGKVTLMNWGVPAGYDITKGAAREVVVPAGVAAYAIAEPFELAPLADALRGRLVDAAGKPIAGAKVAALKTMPLAAYEPGEPVVADAAGAFALPGTPEFAFAAGHSTLLRIETAGGQHFEAAALAGPGVALVRVPTLQSVAAPVGVAPADLAGVVVGTDGQPLEGVKVHISDWRDDPGSVQVTRADGRFRYANLDARPQIRFSKPGYSPVVVLRQDLGVGLVVALDSSTYCEGTVRGPDGKPAAGAVVRADQGRKYGSGVIPSLWTETTADAAGRYRLYVHPEEYEIQVLAPGVGTRRLPKAGIGHGQPRTLDIRLDPAVTFRAKVTDSVTGKPAAGLRLYSWRQKAVAGVSDANGDISIPDLTPGEFEFSVESKVYARWWSEAALVKWQRKSIDDPATGWQRNFDSLKFDLTPGMKPVAIVAEPHVTITGRVVDPDGKPVGGATAAPARTGSGNSLTGDTRFSTRTKPDGSFTMTLPASGAAEYNLVAHDGDYQEWRAWANGVLPPVKTVPGQRIDGVELRLTRGGTVRGTVVDAAGKPVAGREVQAKSADLRENRYYDPATTTRADGTFELKFIRAGEHFVQVAPLWMDPAEAPAGTWTRVAVKAGGVVDGLKMVAAPAAVR